MVSGVLIAAVAAEIAATPPGGPPPDGAGRSAPTKEHGPKEVAEPQVPMTLCDVWPPAVPNVRVEPEIVQVSQLAPVAEQVLAPGEGGGKTLLCARPSWANQPTRMAHAANQMKRLETCISVFVIDRCLLIFCRPAL